jgi:glycine/D-amino acid oxidase-like deaminating enzyme
VLLERKQLTSGTTWHAAGLIGQLRGSANMTRLAKYSADLYASLEPETGVATGMRQVGDLGCADLARHEELLRVRPPSRGSSTSRCMRFRPLKSARRNIRI